MLKFLVKSEHLKVFIIFFIISLIFLLPAFFSKGTFVGADWSAPYTKIQTMVSLTEDLSPWKHTSLVGHYFPTSDFQYSVFSYFLYSLGIQKGFFAKFFLLFVYALGSFGMYGLARYMKISLRGALLCGFFYLTSPFMFNFTIIGWDYILLSLVLLPYFIILFDKSVREKNIYLLFCSTVIFWIALLQSTSIIWYSLVVFSLLFSYIQSKELLNRYIVYTVIFYLITFLLNFYWMFNLLVFKNSVIHGSDNVLRSASLGTWLQVNIPNIIRGWGSLYNMSFETSYIGLVKFIPLLFFLFFVFIFIKVKEFPKFNKYSLLIIFLFPIALYLIGPYKLALFPFSNVLRDGGRHIALVSFVFSIILGIGFDIVKKSNNTLLAYLLIILVILNAHPFFLGELYKKPAGSVDVRLRTYDYPNDFEVIEKYLFNSKEPGKVIYVPTYDVYYDFSTKNFNGGYNGFTSIFTSVSPREGSVRLVDKEDDGINLFYNTMVDRILYDFDNSIGTILKKLDIRYFVFYFDNMNPKDWNLYTKIAGSEKFEDISTDVFNGSSKKSAIFRVKNPSPEITAGNNYLYVNKFNIFYYDSLFSYLKNYDLIYADNVLDLNSDFSRIYFPERYYSIDLNNPKLFNVSFPKANMAPSSLLSYRLLKQKEAKQEKASTTFNEKIKILMNQNLIRVSEMSSFPKEAMDYSYKSFIDNYFKIKDAFLEVPGNKRDARYFLTLQELYSQIDTIDSFFYSKHPQDYKTISYNPEDRNTLLDDFTKWISSNYYICDNFCYYFDTKPSGGLNLTFSGTQDPQIKNPLDGKEVYDLKPQSTQVINFNDVKKAQIITHDQFIDSADTDLKDVLETVVSQVKSSEVAKTVNGFSSLKAIKTGNTESAANYEFTIGYKNVDKDMVVAIIEEFGNIRSDYEAGAKEQNVIYSKRPAYVYSPVTDSNKPATDIFSVTKQLKSDNATKGFIILLFNSDETMTDFSFSGINSPSVFYFVH